MIWYYDKAIKQQLNHALCTLPNTVIHIICVDGFEKKNHWWKQERKTVVDKNILMFEIRAIAQSWALT